MLTSKCASRHNGVHIFDIATSKSGPTMLCFVHFDFEMCFAPQRRAFFHLSLASWLRTRRFSEPTFRLSGATNQWKNTMFRNFPTFSRICIFFLLTLSSILLSSNLSLLSASALLCFSSVHIVGSLTSKLPSIISQWGPAKYWQYVSQTNALWTWPAGGSSFLRQVERKWHSHVTSVSKHGGSPKIGQFIGKVISEHELVGTYRTWDLISRQSKACFLFNVCLANPTYWSPISAIRSSNQRVLHDAAYRSRWKLLDKSTDLTVEKSGFL